MTRSRCLLVLAAASMFACPKRDDHVHRPTPRPERVVLIVVDQLRADLIDRVDMPNLRKLRDGGAWFENAHLGHLTAKTVVGHAVVTRGVFPKRIGWSDDLFRDVEGKLGPAGTIWDAGGLTHEQIDVVMNASLPPGFAEAFRPKHRGVFSIAEKNYAARMMVGSDPESHVITLGSKLKEPDVPKALAGWMRPEGRRIPDYLALPIGNRFWLDGRPSYGTESNPYALGGNKYWPGDDPAHQGGDVWVADAARAVIENERDWAAIYLSMGAVDRVGHMMGADHDLDSPNPSVVRFETALKIADAQIGRVLAALDEKGLRDSTLVVVTADHGGMYVPNLQARERPGKASEDWNWGKLGNAELLDPQPQIAKVVATGKVVATSTDTMLRFWTTDTLASTKAVVAQVVSTLPGVVAIYQRADGPGGSRYEPVPAAGVSLDALPPDERAWLEAHAQPLLDSTASLVSADVLAFLDEKTGYAVRGDHGGAQRKVQSIPILFSGPGVRPGRYPGEARMVDIAPTVWALARDATEGQDGVALCAAVLSSPCPL